MVSDMGEVINLCPWQEILKYEELPWKPFKKKKFREDDEKSVRRTSGHGSSPEGR